jgi:hypothetical protein
MYINESFFNDFLAEREITWIGIDFSRSKFTKNGFEMPQEAIFHFFNDLNLLIISDQKKYDIRLSFRKPVMHYDLSLITKKNKSVKIGSQLTEKISVAHQFSEADVMQYVSSYEITVQSRFALTLMVESLDKNSKTASIWVVLLDTHTRQVILCEKFLKTPSGLTNLSFWARVFYNLLFDIKSHSFERWVNLIQST